MKRVDVDVYEYHLEEFTLTLYSNTSVVEVRVNDEKPTYLDKFSDLPDWVFNPNALWIRNGITAIDGRIRDGERTREYLLMHPPVYVRPRPGKSPAISYGELERRTAERRMNPDRRRYRDRRDSESINGTNPFRI